MIDDNDAVSAAVQICLRREGFNVICAQGREEITRLIATKDFDLVVTDLVVAA